MVYTLAIDIGGTKIATGVLDENRMWVAEHVEQSDVTSPEKLYISLLTGIESVLEKEEIRHEQIKNIGVALPGQVDIEEGIAIYSNNLPWRNFCLGDLLRADFPESTIGFEHDVTAAALGEFEVRGKKSELFVYVTISTGIGACILYKGEPMRGTGLAGEIGFFPVGKMTLETYASGSAMEREMVKELKGNSLSEAFTLWIKGEKKLDRFFDSKAYQIALALLKLTAALDPHKIVLGGGVINNQPLFYELILKHYIQFCTHPLQQDWKFKLEPSTLKNRSGLYGAACKVLEKQNINSPL